MVQAYMETFDGLLKPDKSQEQAQGSSRKSRLLVVGESSGEWVVLCGSVVVVVLV